MDMLPKHFKNVVYILSAILAGICLFFSLTGIYIGNTVFKPEFHKQLFSKNNIYDHTHNVIAASMKDYISDFQKNSPQTYEQHKDIFTLLQKSTTSEMVQKNLDSLIEGIFSYISGQKKFLPNIYLNSLSEDEKTIAPSDADNTGGLTTQALTKVDKVNLGAVLQYINRNDIIDYLSILRFIYYIVTALPAFFMLILLVLCLTALSFSTKFTDAAKWLKLFFIAFSSISLGAGLCIIVYTYLIMPGSISPLTMSLPLQGDVIISYIKDCLNKQSAFLIILNIFGLCSTIGIFFLQKTLPSVFLKQGLSDLPEGNASALRTKMQAYILENNAAPKSRLRGRVVNSLYILFILAILVSLVHKYFIIEKDFADNDFHTVLLKMKGSPSVTEVIAAKDAAIYDVEVKVFDQKTNKPLPNLQVYVFGKSTADKNEFNETKLTDADGSVKFSLDKGSFRLSFNPSTFPSQYVIPTPFFFDLKAAGTKIFTINLETVQSNQKWGIVEIEVLDGNNKPVKGMELTIPDNISAPGNPDKLFSTTNTEGIAVFKIHEGDYTASFAEAYFPKKYLLPDALNVTSTYNIVSRYTIRLVDAPAHSSPSAASQSPRPSPVNGSANPRR